MFRHPKYYKELRKLRNKLDQAISDEASTEATSVRPGPGLEVQVIYQDLSGLSCKQQAIEETVPHIDIQEAASTSKPQATSEGKRQATSGKRQASK